jgi:heme-degrading monooxygenase HmoA
LTVPAIVSGAGYATFINTFRCEPSDQGEVVRINVDFIETRRSKVPGFISASVHRSVDGTLVINYLQWRSAEHLAAMQRSSEFQAIARGFAV